MRAILPVIVIAITIPLFPGQRPAASDIEGLQQTRQRILNEIAKYKADQQAARTMVDQANSYALRNDPASQKSAAQAAVVAGQALEKATRLLARAESRLAALDRALSAAAPDAVFPSAIRGTVEIRRGSSWVLISKTDVFGPGDEIRTGSTGTVELYLSDGARFDLGPNSSVTFTAGNDVSLSNGILHVDHFCPVGCVERRRYRTPTVALAVRGTGFTVEQSTRETLVSVYEGTVEVTPTSPPKGRSPFSVGTGQRLTISTKGMAGPVEAFDPVKSYRWWEEQP